MVNAILIWLPGGQVNAQHRRLRTILTPLCSALRARGRKVYFRSMLEDDVSTDPVGVNIWLATELAEIPPRGGANILWFLTQMKVMSQPVLMAYDAIMTSSSAHQAFLKNWLGDVRHIGFAGWPVPQLDTPRSIHDKAALLELEPISDNPSRPSARIRDLPADAVELQDYFQRYACIQSNVALRERMCGFYGYEEVVALLSGCNVTSDERRGLLSGLDLALNHRQAAEVQGDPVAKLMQGIMQMMSPQATADAVMDAVTAAEQSLMIPPSKEDDVAHPFVLGDQRHPQDDWGAFWRDAAYILQHSVVKSLLPASAEAHDFDLSKPWDVLGRLAGTRVTAPYPWTDLSLTRCFCDSAACGDLILTAEDCARVAKTAICLARYQLALSRPDAPKNRFEVPWQGVANASADSKRILRDLSRELNGHNLYRFSQSVGKPKKLSGQLDDTTAGNIGFTPKIAVFLHAFYVDVARSILTQLPPLLRKCAIYVTTDHLEKVTALDSILVENSWTRFQTRVVENKGRDIYTKLIELAGVHAEYDFVLHLHTKKSPHSKSLANWGKEAVDSLAGTGEAIARVLSAFQMDDRLGIVYPTPPEILHPAMTWARNLRISEMLAARIGLSKLEHSEHLDFPAGSMFWARTSAIRQILQADLGSDIFPIENGQEDGTPAHGLERLLGVVSRYNGFTMAQIGRRSGSSSAG